jgi:hypothetical protein
VEEVQEKVKEVERLGACVRGGGGGSHLEDRKELEGAHDWVAARNSVFLGFDLLQLRHLKQDATKKATTTKKCHKVPLCVGRGAMVMVCVCVGGGGGGK